MKEENLVASIERLGKQADRDRQLGLAETAKRRKMEAILAQEHLSFDDLSQRNTSTINRANYLFDALRSQHKLYVVIDSSCEGLAVVLGNAQESPITPNHKTVCLLTLRSERQKDKESGHRQNPHVNMDIRYAFMSDGCDDLECIKNYPYGSNNTSTSSLVRRFEPNLSYHGDYMPRIGDDVITGSKESSYPYIKDEFSSSPDDTYVDFGLIVPKMRIFRPTSMRAQRKVVASRLESLEATLISVEQAARNPELNPALCHGLEHRDQLAPDARALNTTDLFAL